MNNQQKLIILAAVVGVSAIGLLLILSRKRQDDVDENGEGNEEELEFPDLTANEMTAGASETIIQVKVPKYVVGSIIGKGGQNIRQLKKETGARLDFEKENDNQESDGNEERILEIRGERQNVYNAELKIRKIIEETPQNITIEFLVPQKACGRIIGRGGQTIKEMSTASKARILVQSNVGTSDEMAKVKITGTPEQVDYAKALVEEQVEMVKLVSGKYKRTRSSATQQQQPKTVDMKSSFPRKRLPNEDGFFQVFVSAFDVPSHLFVQVVDSQSSKLDQLVQDMTDYYTNVDQAESNQLISGITVGDLCCAPFEFDELWYRASILEIDSNNRMVAVYYIDFGDTGKVSLDNLRKPKPEFLELEAQAIECCLAEVQPKGESWSEDGIKRFEDLTQCAQWSVLMARITDYEETANGTLPCLELIDTKGDEEINIAQRLIEENFADALSVSNDSKKMNEPGQVINDQKSANNNKIISAKELKDVAKEHLTHGEKVADFDKIPELIDIDDTKRDSADASSISSASTEDTVIHATAKIAEHAQRHDSIPIESLPSNNVGQTQPLTHDDGVNGNITVANENPDLEHGNVVNGQQEPVENVNALRQKVMSSNDEVNKWIERSVRTEDESGDQHGMETTDLPMHQSTEAGHDESESVPGRLLFQNSMELAKENPFMLSDDEDSLSYMSARSEMTIASNSQDTDNDTLSFKSAPDTPTNSNNFEFPPQQDTDVEYEIIKTPVGSDDEVLGRPFSFTSPDTMSSPPNNTSPSKYQIKVIDETPKGKAGSMETLTGSYTPYSHGNDDTSMLSSSPQRISQLSSSSPQFGSLKQIGKETSI